MAKPEPEPIDPTELPALAQAVMADAKFPMLASIDGDQPRLRPVSPVKTDGFTVYVANLKAYHKTQEIAANPKVELCYCLLYTSPSPRDKRQSRMPSSA